MECSFDLILASMEHAQRVCKDKIEIIHHGVH